MFPIPFPFPCPSLPLPARSRIHLRPHAPNPDKHTPASSNKTQHLPPNLHQSAKTILSIATKLDCNFGSSLTTGLTGSPAERRR